MVVATQRDDAALVTLTARQLNKHASIVVAVREDENVPLLKQEKQHDLVITSSSAAGRLLGMSMASPNVGTILEDLLTYGNGLDLDERPVTRSEAGRSPRELEDLVVAVVLRGHRVLNYTDPQAATLELTDRVITIRQAVPSS